MKYRHMLAATLAVMSLAGCNHPNNGEIPPAGELPTPFPTQSTAPAPTTAPSPAATAVMPPATPTATASSTPIAATSTH